MEAVGRVPNTAKLGLDVAGVRTDNRGAVIVDEELRTTAPHVWAAGDVIGSTPRIRWRRRSEHMTAESRRLMRF
jgi:probable pyridine nucleotide-disulfide oxidoreductase